MALETSGVRFVGTPIEPVQGLLIRRRKTDWLNGAVHCNEGRQKLPACN